MTAFITKYAIFPLTFFCPLFSFRGGKYILHLVICHIHVVYIYIVHLATKGIVKEKLLTKLLHLFKVKDLTDIRF